MATNFLLSPRRNSLLLSLCISLAPLTTSASEKANASGTNSTKSQRAAPPISSNKQIPLSETTFTFGGFAKLDLLITNYQRGDVEPESPLRDMHIPASIPVGSNNRDLSDLDFHVKESRFYFSTDTRFRNDETLHSYFEMDFILAGQGDERVSNSFNPRMRHFYFTYGPLLFGQTWSTFMIIDSVVEDIDFAGTADGMVFVRQPQARLSFKGFQVSIENPEITVDNSEGQRVVTEAGTLPDLVFRYNLGGRFGSLSAAALGRQLKHEYIDQESNEERSKSAIGLAGTIGGRTIVFDNDDIRYQFTAGQGIGRYASLNFSNAGHVDSENNIHPAVSYLGLIGYRHLWNEKWRSNLNVSAIHIDNEGPPETVNRRAASASVNLLYSPLPPLTFGVELMRAYRELEDGNNGAFNRLQFAAKYNFEYTTKPFSF